MVAFVTHGYGVFPYLHCRFAVHKLQGLILSKLGHHCIFLETRCLGRDSSCSWLPFITLPLRLWQRAMTIRHACCGHYSQGASDLVGFRECTRRLNFSGLPKMRESHHTHSHLLLTWSFCHGRGDGIDVLARPLAAQASEQITSARRPQVWQSALWIWALPWDRSATRLVSFIVLGQ